MIDSSVYLKIGKLMCSDEYIQQNINYINIKNENTKNKTIEQYQEEYNLKLVKQLESINQEINKYDIDILELKKKK